MNTIRDYRLLIVDDDRMDRRLYCRLLGQAEPDRWCVHEAEDGASGLAALRTETFDCVLLDFNLPSMNGFEFLTEAMVDGELPCATVLITGQGNEALAVEAMKRGVQDYLVKDQVNANNLQRAVLQAVAQVNLRRRLAGSLRDLTAANLALEEEAAIRKAAEAELRASKEAADQANQAKTRFVAMVTHELRTPLNGILGYAQLLRLEGGLSVRQDAQVGAMMQAGRHLLEMIEGVLDFASIETGRMELRPKPVAVRDLTEACIACISPMASQRALGLRVVNAHDAPRRIVVDASRLRQVLLNLLGNAVKYTDTGCVELRVLAGASPGGLRIEVADTGRGIDAAGRDRLFKDFERLDATSSVEGAGLGLAIAARIVRLMGGTIGHMPNPNGVSPNTGSVFWLELPGAGPEPAAGGEQPPAAGAGTTAGIGSVRSVTTPGAHPAGGGSAGFGWRVLLVDDIKINLDIISSFLEAAGHAVVLANSGEEAVALAGAQRFDLILLDVRMPVMDGLEAARRIRRLDGPHGLVPILALTAYTSVEQVALCLDAGMDGHVPKPVDYDTLIRAIDDMIARAPT